MDRETLYSAREAAFGLFKAGWDASVAKGGGTWKNYCGEPYWDMLARQEFESFWAESFRLWEEANLAAGIRAFNQVFVERAGQVIPTPLEASGKLWG